MLNSVMNNTKWDEVRLAMYALDPSPTWSTLVMNGHSYGSDGEWFYHFRDGGYEDIIHVDIHVATSQQRELVQSALKKIHVPGEETADGSRVFGFIERGQFIHYT
ncbi:DUF6678 family protein [Rhizobium populisoli]|uniref:DUF6678 family protein n=1 Tax=Rhizobium populisoli TaxID=2859785 RepID=UPI001FE45917|nr:DUF6678 family protein [Rhizobium populisoli]